MLGSEQYLPKPGVLQGCASMGPTEPVIALLIFYRLLMRCNAPPAGEKVVDGDEY